MPNGGIASGRGRQPGRGWYNPSSRGTKIPHGAAGAADHARVQAGGHGPAGHDAGALPPLPAHPHLRAARPARSSDFRVCPWHPPRGRRPVTRAAPLRRGRPDARGRLSRRAHRRARMPAPSWAPRWPCPALFAGEFIALPFAVGCGFAGGGLRELCPKEAIWHFSPFVFSSLPRRLWQLFKRFEVDWQVILLLAPVALELLRQVLGHRFGAPPPVLPGADERPRPRAHRARDSALCRNTDQDLEQRPDRASAAGTGEAADGGAALRAGEPDQPALPVQHAGVDCVARSLPARNRAHGDPAALGTAPAAHAQPGPFRGPARRAVVDRRIPGHRSHQVRTTAARAEGDRPGDARRAGAQHDPSADHRELDQARAVSQDRRRAHPDPHDAGGTAPRRSRSWTTGSG